MPGFRSNYRGTKNLCKRRRRRRRRKMSKRSRFALLLFFTPTDQRAIDVCVSRVTISISLLSCRALVERVSRSVARKRATRSVSPRSRKRGINRRALSRRKRSFRSNLLPTLLSSSTFRIESSVFSSFFPRFLSLVLSILIEITRDYCIEEETRYRAEERIRIF